MGASLYMLIVMNVPLTEGRSRMSTVTSKRRVNCNSLMLAQRPALYAFYPDLRLTLNKAAHRVSFPLFFIFHRVCFMLPVFPHAERPVFLLVYTQSPCQYFQKSGKTFRMGSMLITAWPPAPSLDAWDTPTVFAYGYGMDSRGLEQDGC